MGQWGWGSGGPSYLAGAGGGSELADSLVAGPGVPFFPQHSSWHHTQHSPSLPACVRCLLTSTERGTRTFVAPWKCAALPSSTLGAREMFRVSSILWDVNRCECGCDLHQRPSNASDVNSKAATLEIPGSCAADSSKFYGCTKGKECHCMLSFFIFSLSFKLFHFFSQLLQNSRGTDGYPSGSGPHLGILLFY